MSRIIRITDFSAPELDVYGRLSEPQLLHYNEPDGGIFIAESPRVILRALDKGCRPLSLLAELKQLRGEGLEVLARCKDIPVYTAESQVLTQLTGFHLTRGMLCAMERPVPLSVDELCTRARRVAVLENVMNPTNIGAIIRSAAALGMDGVLLGDGCSDPLYRRAIRVSMGTVFQIPWTYLNGLSLSRLGFKTAAMALRDQSVNVDDPALAAEEKLAVFLGSEGDGLSDSTIASCDYTVKIPMFHGVDSLNVAAASAVVFWQLRSHLQGCPLC
ncbi:MAG: RNA methyltransferase [Hungatella sp.]|nr:RNA methyltransferase [Hungatella sp.]